MSLTINHNLMSSNIVRSLSSEYKNVGNSVRKLSSGLRVGTAADDAAGLAIRELMRADISSLHQGIRNANDAISAVQVADGALQVIDEKLIRMKELAMQASTGSYNSAQRIIINSEYQAMASEIQRIAVSTDFNGIHLLDGSLSGEYDGRRNTSEGALHIHFGTGNDSAEDYYSMQIKPANLVGLGLAEPQIETSVPALNSVMPKNILVELSSGIRTVASIPANSENLVIDLDSLSADDDFQIFTRNGVHLAGTSLVDNVWIANGVDASNVNSMVINTANGFLPGAVYDSSHLLDGRPIADGGLGTAAPYGGPYSASYNGMNFSYSGDGDMNNDGMVLGAESQSETFRVDKNTEELLIFSVGSGVFRARANWSKLGGDTGGDYIPYKIDTQSEAQNMLGRIDNAIEIKDNIRAGLGALQNRLENTVTNLSIQAENLQSSESGISDIDVAIETTELTRQQILTQSSTAMLAQANSLPKIALQLLNT